MSEGFKSDEVRSEMQRSIDAARQLQSIKAKTAGGKTFKARNTDLAMRPLLQPNDLLEIGGANPMKLKTGDLLYYRLGSDEYRVRRLVRRHNEGADLSFVVSDADGKEDRVVDGQIFGVVVSYERRGEVVRLKRDFAVEAGNVTEKVVGVAQEAWNRICGLFNRKSGD